VILTPHRGPLYNREIPFCTPMRKDSLWIVLSLSRYPRFVQESTGTPFPLGLLPSVDSISAGPLV